LATFAFVVIALQTSCMGISLISTPVPFKAEKWREEVPLSNGTSIWVERETVPGQRFYSINGSSYIFEPEQRLKLPDGTIWNSLANNPLLKMSEPTLIDQDEQSWILVIKPSFLGEHLRLGCPVPNFLYMRSSAQGWVRVAPKDIPGGLKFNLYMRSKRTNAITYSVVTAKTRDEIHAQWLLEEQAKHEKYFSSSEDRRYSVSSPLSNLVVFSKVCDPKKAICFQERFPECDAANLQVAP
jgi:hypothetical protein